MLTYASGILRPNRATANAIALLSASTAHLQETPRISRYVNTSGANVAGGQSATFYRGMANHLAGRDLLVQNRSAVVRRATIFIVNQRGFVAFSQDLRSMR